MRAIFIIILLAALVLPSGQASASPLTDISAADLQTLHAQAAQGEAKAQNNLGLLYYNGRGVPQDYAKAREWWEKASAQGNAVAQYNLGVLYDFGRGVPQDYAKARQWYEKAAAQGYVDAQYNLGVLYDFGWGVPQDYAVAREWVEKAAAQGHARAQTNLGVLYQNGQSIPRDYVRAYMWYTLAAGHLSGDAQRFAANNRDKVARRMTPAQVVEAQRLTQQCLARKFKGC